MEAAAVVAATARNPSLPFSSPHPPPRKEWRAIDRNAGNEDLERSKVGQSDERTIYEQGRVQIEVVDYNSTQIGGGGIGVLDDDLVQQRLHALARQRDSLARQRDALARQGEEMQEMEIELRAQVIARSEILEMQNNCDAQIKEQVNVAAQLQEQLREREQKIHDLERKMDDQERKLHAMRLDNEKAWAKEDLLREQNKELANFRRERDNIEAERAHHLKQIHDLQDHFQEKERQLMELQEQHRIAQENILYKEEQLREAQTWISRVQEMDVLQSSQNHSLQAELRERTEQYNQLWLSCQRQFAEMERLHVQTIQQLQLELAAAREKSGQFNDELRISQTNLKDVSHFVQNNGSHCEADGAGTPNGSAAGLQNGNSGNSESFVSSGNVFTQANHVAGVIVTPPSLLGLPSYLPPEQMAALRPYIVHQQGVNNSVPSHVPHPPLGQFHSLPAISSLQHWPTQQVTEGQPKSKKNQLPSSQSEENHPNLDSDYGFEISVNGSSLHPEYLSTHVSQGIEPNLVMSSTEEAQVLESVDKSYLASPHDQQSLEEISSQFHEALRLNPLEAASVMKVDDNSAITSSNAEPETQSLTKEQANLAASSSSIETPIDHQVLSSEKTSNNSPDVGEAESYISNGQTSSLSTEKGSDAALLDERSLLACIARTIPAGGKIHISSTLPNRLAKMLAPLHWHDYKKKYGKLDDFVASHPELFVIEGDYIQLREGAQGIIAATAAVAKVAAAAAATSPYPSFFPSVAVTPMAQANRLKKVSSLEAKPVRTLADTPSLLPAMQGHSNGVGYNISGGLSNVKILSKSKDSLELNGVTRSGQPSSENGALSDKAGFNARTSTNFVSKQHGRKTAPPPSASRR
ncbi:hypothetical protein Dimus_028139 [Dionaea muscipula]